MTSNSVLPNLGATHLNHIYCEACDSRIRGLQKSNLPDIMTHFAEYRAYELGWYQNLSEADFVELLGEEQRLEKAHAMGQDLDWHEKRRQVLEAIFEAGDWTIDMDTGRPMRKAADAGRNQKLMDDLARCLQHAVERVRIANAEGNPILSAWLPEAEKLLGAAAAR